MRLGCLCDQARMDFAVRGEAVSLLIDARGLVVINGSGTSKVDLSFGEQRLRSIVVRFFPSDNTELGTQGVVRTIEFTNFGR